jgi:hypothetical protein
MASREHVVGVTVDVFAVGHISARRGFPVFAEPVRFLLSEILLRHRSRSAPSFAQRKSLERQPLVWQNTLLDYTAHTQMLSGDIARLHLDAVGENRVLLPWLRRRRLARD